MCRFIKNILCPTLLVWAAFQAQASDLEKDIRRLIDGKKAQVGVAVIVNGKDTFTVNNDFRYPLMSVFKFQQSLAVADFMRMKGLPLETEVHITRDELKPDTYSPMRDHYGRRKLSLSIKQLLEYSLQQSDNNACDILFRYIGGTAYVDSCIRTFGAEHFAITATEDEMQHDSNASYRNWTYPLETARLLDSLVAVARLGQDGYLLAIKDMMINCTTGQDRMVRPLLGTSAVVGHKTGTGGRNTSGQMIAVNDAGFVLLPDGRYYVLAVFVADSEESEVANAEIIADISEAVYRYVIGEGVSK